MPDPYADRPHMPAYGIAPAGAGAGLLPWSWAVERLQAAHNYWVSTRDEAGAPHAAAVWGVWLDDTFLFDTAPDSKKARNIEIEPRCVITTDRADEAVIVSGDAEPWPEDADVTRYLDAYEAKYGSRPPGRQYLVRPRRVFGFIEAEDQFGQTATRWTFPAR